MRILCLSFDFPPEKGGIQVYTYELIKQLTIRGLECLVIAPSRDGDIDFDRKQDFKIIRIPRIDIAAANVLLYAVFGLYYILKYKPQRIYSFNWYPLGVSTLLLSFIFKMDYFVSAYALEFLIVQNKLKMSLMKSVFNNARKIIAISNYTKRNLIHRSIKPEKIEVFYPGIDISKIKKEIDSSDIIRKHSLEGKKIMLTVSTLLFPYKGHELVINALPFVIKEVPDVRYIIIGDGPLRNSLEEQVEKLSLKENVIFVGSISDSELPKYYNACNIFVLPSGGDETKGEVEGFGIVYSEANAYGKPVIGYRLGGAEDAIVHGETGILIDKKDKGILANAVIHLLKDEKYAKKLGEQGRERVEKELDWEIIGEKIYKVIQD